MEKIDTCGKVTIAMAVVALVGVIVLFAGYATLGMVITCSALGVDVVALLIDKENRKLEREKKK